ncbi:MAG: response regulator [Deltaproteobacteria bacterium]|nr:MAG: response regulator [Deltaproteobacteria bacterium]
MPNAEEARRQEVILRRLVAMGLDARSLPGGRSVVAILPLGSAPFESVWGDQRFEAVRFATVGVDRAKCLSPRPLFHLPMIRIVDCDDMASIEARLRSAWSSRVRQLEAAAVWLEKLGFHVRRDPSQPFLELPIEVEGGCFTATVIEPHRVVLPAVGPLSGFPLGRAEDRQLEVDADCESATDLELALTVRLEELARLGERLAREENARTAERPAVPTARDAGHHILLVGPRLVDNKPLIESLRLRGYRVVTARSANEALRTFETASPELVFTDTRLGRSDGIDLIPALRALEGMEEIPVVLVDDRARAELREAARRLGGAGYLVHPIDFPKVEKGLVKLVSKPRRRRFTRYPHRVSVRWGGCDQPGHTTNLGRGGMLLATLGNAEIRSIDRYQISVAELGETIHVDAEVAYRIRAPGSSQVGIGLRFVGFPDDDEATLISVLSSLSPTASNDGGSARR